MHREILSDEEFFSEYYTHTFFDHSRDIYTRVPEGDNSSKYSSDSDNMNIRTIKRQKKKNLSDKF